MKKKSTGLGTLRVAKPTGEGPGNDYEAKADAHTLVEAHKIRADKGRHAKAKGHLKVMIGHMKGAMSKETSYTGANDNDGDEGNKGV